MTTEEDLTDVALVIGYSPTHLPHLPHLLGNSKKKTGSFEDDKYFIHNIIKQRQQRQQDKKYEDIDD